jgi:hypothetical protein
MSIHKQRHANGERSKAQFATDVTKELNRLEAEINRQAKCLVPARIMVTQESVAEATGHHRTTFKGKYHKHLRERLAKLRKRAKDPKGVHVQSAEQTKIKKVSMQSSETPHPRIDALQEANKRLANENRLLRRQLYLKRPEKNETWEAYW